MKNALLKDIFREIKGSLSKFFSIFAIVALGVGFFAGIKATCPDMKITADKYFDEYRLMDMRLVSTIGFNDEDVDMIKKISKAEGVYPSYSMDALINGKDGDMVLKVLPLPMDKIKSSNESYINRTKLVQGRYPQNTGEAVAEKGKMMDLGLAIGSKVKLYSGTDEDISENIKKDEYTIVGMVETPYYITDERGTADIGSGKVDSFIMIPYENFKMPAYTDVFLIFGNAREILTFDDEYDEILEPKRKKLDNLGKSRAKKRYDEIIGEVNEKLEENKEKFKHEKKKAEDKLTAAAKKIEDGKKEILDGENRLNKEERQFKQTIKDAEDKIVNGQKELEKGEKEYDRNYKAFVEIKKQAKIEILKVEKEIEKNQKQIAEGKAYLEEIENQLGKLKKLEEELGKLPEKLQEERLELEQVYVEVRKELKVGEKKLKEGKSELELGKKELKKGEKEFTIARKILDDSKEELAEEKSKFVNGKIEAEDNFAIGRKELEDSKKKLEKGKKDYEKAKKETEKELTKAYEKIAEGERKIEDIEEPKWYVIKRNQTLDFIDYEMAADRIDAIAKVFPVFFFLIAALVSFTTMTRMVDEQRVYIGTLKALGYSKIAIASKYIIYAGLASVSGGIIGVLLGFKVFPTIIFNSYRIIYIMPPIVTEFNVYYAIISIIFGVFSTTFAAWSSVYKELVETPALLMRPKTQKPGKRILLERIKPIWSRFNFTQKVTARNLIRYKKRLFMTILGVGGCTALMVAGFGLKDSILETPTKQYDDIYQYDMKVNVKDERLIDIEELVEKNKGISDYMLMKEENVKLSVKEEEKDAFLIIPKDFKEMENFIILRDRVTGKKIPLKDNGIVLTEKMSKLLNVDIGDDLIIKDEQNRKIKTKISGITENYVAHYVYMTSKLYEELYGKEAEFQNLLTKNVDTSDSFEEELSTELLKNSEVVSVDFITGISSSYEDMVGSLNYVVLVLIISAGALAFVVLYNLTNVNVSERMREIATIKVLGFYDNEVSAYVYNENTILTVIGIILGLIMGYFLHRYIILTGEIDYIMFGRVIKPISFVYSAILTVVFGVLVNFAMYFKLQKIEMVESLKSIE